MYTICTMKTATLFDPKQKSKPVFWGKQYHYQNIYYISALYSLLSGLPISIFLQLTEKFDFRVPTKAIKLKFFGLFS